MFSFQLRSGHALIIALTLATLPVLPVQAEEIDDDAPASSSNRGLEGFKNFNPKFSLIFDGIYYRDNVEGEGEVLADELAGINHAHGDDDHGHEHGTLEEGFNLREAELMMSGAVDPYFSMFFSLAVSDSDIELEELYFETLGLPAGLALKGGKFLSDIGYQNAHHPHTWDFVDQNLPYRTFFGAHGLLDTGLQLTYLAPTDTYLLLGAEVLQGKQDKFGTLVDDDSLSSDAGPRIFTGFLKLGPDLGLDHALQLGTSLAYASQHQEDHSDDVNTELLEGDSGILGFDLVYKRMPTGAYGKGGVKLATEYFFMNKRLEVIESSADPGLVGEDAEGKQDGLYVQATWGFASRWQLGGRYEVVGLINEIEEGGAMEDLESSDRFATAITWSPTEFSRLRLQGSTGNFSFEDGESERVNQVYLQLILSLGAHGAHRY